MAKLRARRAFLQRLVPLGAWLIALVLLLLRWTTRKELLHDHGLYDRWRAGERLIVAFWHEHLVLMPCFGWWPRVCIMISQHRDGELIARAVRPLGIEAVRGSSTRGGRGALRRVLAAYREGASLAWTPDGPRGPRRLAKLGVVQTARATGATIVPVGAAARWHRRLGSWDRMVLPYPGSRITFVVGTPVRVAGDASDTDLEAARARLEHELERARVEAEARVGGNGPGAANCKPGSSLV
ncbi:MAG: lysophospholipid acyltransferase family protein [Deltaproteobacteria bacterium]|nr:lysophospholipid acyltransferase family protein [Deltaproteobacteria bacterium]